MSGTVFSYDLLLMMYGTPWRQVFQRLSTSY